jgi:hypothetical protein
MLNPNNQIVSFLVSLFGGGVIGGLVAAYVTNKFTETRDRKARWLDFMRLLGEWRVKTLRTYRPADLSRDFPQTVAKFGGAYIALERDLWYWKRAKFHSLCDQIVAMTDSEVETTDNEGRMTGKGLLLKRIETLIAFMEAN